MTSRDFCFWLQGYFELSDIKAGLASDQVDVIKRHLHLVFAHDIDKSMGNEEHNKKLNDIHTPNLDTAPPGPIFRC